MICIFSEKMNPQFYHKLLLLILLMAGSASVVQAQNGDAKAGVRIDVTHITVGDAARVFLEISHNPATSAIQWAQLPDTFSKLEIVDRTPIDTIKNGSLITYKQRLSVTGFDSGVYTIPSFQFTVLPQGGTPYLLPTDSLQLLVQTVAVDTTKAFRPIKGVITVQYTWRDYIWVIIGALIFLILAAFVILYFVRNKRNKVPVKVDVPTISLEEKAQSLLQALDNEQLWQKGQVKEYYVRLTDILRGYVEARYQTAALELTTDELIEKARITPGLLTIAQPLETILRTADLAKFAKAQPLPQEHIQSMELARSIIATAKPAPVQTPPTSPT